jgi:hypothetical protein
VVTFADRTMRISAGRCTAFDRLAAEAPKQAVTTRSRELLGAVAARDGGVPSY